MKVQHILALGFLLVDSVSASACRPRKSSASSSSLSASSSLAAASSSASSVSSASSSPSVSSSSSLHPSSSSASPASLSSLVLSSSASPLPSASSSSSSSLSPSVSSSISSSVLSSISSHSSPAPFSSPSHSSSVSHPPSSSSSHPSIPSSPPAACVSSDPAPANAACTNLVTNPFFAYEHATNLYGWTALNQGTGHGLQAYNCGGSSGTPGDVKYCSCVDLTISISSTNSLAGVTQALSLTPEVDYAFSVKYRTLPNNPADVYVSCFLQSTASPQPQQATINLMNNLDVGSSTQLTPNEWLLWQTTFTPETPDWELECYMTASTPAVVYLVDVKIVPTTCL